MNKYEKQSPSEYASDATENVSKDASRRIIKRTQRTIKTANNSIKNTKKTIKTARKTAEDAKKAAKATAKLAKQSAKAAKAAIKFSIKVIKVAVKIAISAIKAIIAAIKELVALIIEGRWIAVVIILVICLIAFIICSCFGIFFNSEIEETKEIDTVITSLDEDYSIYIEEIISYNEHDELKLTGQTTNWKELIAVYAVLTTTDPNNAQEVATMNSDKQNILNKMYWEVNLVDYHTEQKEETIYKRVKEYGKWVVKKFIVKKTYLYIDTQHHTLDEMIELYELNDEQKQMLEELLSDEYDEVWEEVLN